MFFVTFLLTVVFILSLQPQSPKCCIEISYLNMVKYILYVDSTYNFATRVTNIIIERRAIDNECDRYIEKG